MKYKRGDLVNIDDDFPPDFGIVLESPCSVLRTDTKVYFLAEKTVWLYPTADLTLVRGSNLPIEADTTPVGASADSERLDMSVDAPTLSAEREAL